MAFDSLDHLVNDYFYRISEPDETAETVTSRAVTIRLPREYVALAQVVGDYFHLSRSSVMQDLLMVVMDDFFERLPSDTRMSLGQTADDLFLKEFSQISSSGVGLSGPWRWVSLAQGYDQREQEKAA